MLKKIIYILLISFSFLTCTINVEAKELNTMSSINTFEVKHVLEDETCAGILGNPKDEDSTAWLVQEVLGYVRIVGVVLVLVLSSFDFTRAIIQNDEKFMQKVKSHLLTRALALVLLFFIPTIVYALLTAFGIYSTCDTLFERTADQIFIVLKVLS